MHFYEEAKKLWKFYGSLATNVCTLDHLHTFNSEDLIAYGFKSYLSLLQKQRLFNVDLLQICCLFSMIMINLDQGSKSVNVEFM